MHKSRTTAAVEAGASYLAVKEFINGSINARFLAQPAWRFQKSAGVKKTTSLMVHPVGILTYKKYRYLTLSMVNEYRIYIENKAISYFIDCYINT